ncbi:MAG: EF-P lysine aminoacylase EpmA [Gammaproteobacteria bacterium]
MDSLQVDRDWRPSATLDVLRLRATLLGRMRAYFARNHVMEVDTPALSAAATTDPAIHSLVATWHGPGSDGPRRCYLHTSPEFPMKRLLAAGSGDVYQLCKVFRDDERGKLHSPEFTLLEWYRTGFDHLALMAEVEQLLCETLVDIAPVRDVRHWTYRELFQEFADIDPFTVSGEDIAAGLQRRHIGLPVGMDSAPLDAWHDLVMTHVIEPHMGQGLVFVRDFPASQAALARLRSGDPPVAARFEAWLGGVEIANGYHELADADEQRQRFMDDNTRRRHAGLEPLPADERLLAGLRAGLPDCAGVALGIDRLLMVAAGAQCLDEVMAFPIERA